MISPCCAIHFIVHTFKCPDILMSLELKVHMISPCCAIHFIVHTFKCPDILMSLELKVQSDTWDAIASKNWQFPFGILLTQIDWCYIFQIFIHSKCLFRFFAFYGFPVEFRGFKKKTWKILLFLRIPKWCITFLCVQ